MNFNLFFKVKRGGGVYKWMYLYFFRVGRPKQQTECIAVI